MKVRFMIIHFFDTYAIEAMSEGVRLGFSPKVRSTLQHILRYFRWR